MEQVRQIVVEGDAEVFRRFNRMYTKLIGTLNEGLLSTEYSLPEARVLYEIATRETPSAKQIADALAMDQGYLSRILSRLENSGRVIRSASKKDSRAADLALTRSGKAAFRALDTRSQTQAESLLNTLLPSQRAELIRCMRTIEKLVAKSEQKADYYVLRPPRPGDLGWVIQREAVLYNQEYGWDEAFEALVARIVAEFVANFDPKRERCWIAEIAGEPAGHIFLVKHPDQPDTAKLRLLLVEPSARGKGLGQALVKECIGFARAAGYRKITLRTQSILASAHHIYQRAGFHLVREEPHHSFGKDLVGQTWELDLTAIQDLSLAAR